MRRRLVEAVCVFVAAVSGCATPLVTDTPRTATEQLLLSTAADKALEQMDLSKLAGKRVHLDSTNFESVDKGYVIGAVGDRMNAQGALVAFSAKAANTVMALRCGALSVDRGDFLIGLPKLAVPIPFGGTVETPELAILKRTHRLGIAKLSVHAYDVATGKHVVSLGPIAGQARYDQWTIMFFPFTVTDIPEKRDGTDR